MAFTFAKATKKQARLRLALIGVSGSGKTYTALKIASNLGKRIAVIDTERGSASKYADLFEFDTLELETFSPLTYVEAIKAAEAAGYEVLVIDSLSHAWMGKEGALEQVDKAAKRSSSNNSYVAWRDVTPMHNALIDAMLQSRCHIIGTMRAKTEYAMEKDERTGKTAPKKIGMAPVQRDGLEYEFDVVADMDIDNNLIVSKTRCPALTGAVIAKPGKEIAVTLAQWLTEGAPAPEPIKVPTLPPLTKPEPINGNGHTPAPKDEATAPVAHPERPYTPFVLKSGLLAACLKKTGKKAGANELQPVAALLDNMLGGEDQRHEFVKWLTDGKTQSLKDDGPMCLALYDWLKPVYNRDAKVFETGSEFAKAEATAAFVESQRHDGQTELPLS